MSDTGGKQNPEHENEQSFYIHKTSDLIVDMDINEDPKMINICSNIIENKPKNEIPVIKMLNSRPEPNQIVEDTKIEIENSVEKSKSDKTSENKESVNNEKKDTLVVMKVYDTYYNQQPPQGQYQHPMYQQPGQYYGGYGAPMSYDPSSRNGFIKCVLIIVLVMLVLTAAFVTFVLASEDALEFFQTHGMGLMLPATLTLMMAHYAMYCSPCARVPPCNIVCLVITVIAMSVLAAKVSAHYSTEIVLYATIATAAVVFVCILLACSNFDFTSLMLYVVVISTAFSVVAMIVLVTMMITGSIMKPVLIVILLVATLIEVVMLTIELQMILGGRSVELSEDDYALGAFMLYTSILSLFLKMVQLIGFADD